VLEICLVREQVKGGGSKGRKRSKEEEHTEKEEGREEEGREEVKRGSRSSKSATR